MMFRSTIAVAVAVLTGCIHREDTVKTPRAPDAFFASVDAAAPPHATAATAPLATGSVWWSAFADPALDAVIQEAFRNNHILRDVRGLIYENMVDPVVPQGWWWPLQVGIAPAGVRHVVTNIPPSGEPDISYGVANINLSASYQLDLWGGIDAQRQAGLNFAEQQRQLTEARVQDLAVQIAVVWFDILETRALRDLTLAQIEYNEELYELVKARFEQHLTTRLVVLQQEQQLLNLQSQVPLITAQIALLNSRLNGLLGRMPSSADAIVPLDHQLPNIPPAPGIGTPSDLDANTPEMRLARLRVTEVHHRLKANRASWLPTVQVVGSIGAATFHDFRPLAVDPAAAPTPSRFRESSIGVSLTWVMFDGRRVAETRQLPMTLERRELQYELALQTAVGRVQDAVIREGNQATSLQFLQAQVELGRRLLAEARRLFEQGQSDYLPVLTALTNLIELERAGLQAQRLLLNHRVELYRSLGGNWSYDVTKRLE